MWALTSHAFALSLFCFHTVFQNLLLSLDARDSADDYGPCLK